MNLFTKRVRGFCMSSNAECFDQKYESEFRREREHLTELFFNNVLTDSFPCNDALFSNAQLLNIDLSASYKLATFALEKTGLKENPYTLLFYLRHLFNELIFSDGINGFSTFYNSYEAVLILTESDIPNDIYEISDNIIEVFNKSTSHNVTACASNNLYFASEISAIFKKQYHILQYLPHSEFGKVISSDAALGNDFRITSYKKVILYTELDNLLSRNCNSEIGQFINTYFPADASRDTVLSAIIGLHVINGISSFFSYKNIAFESVFGNELQLCTQLFEYKDNKKIRQKVEEIIITADSYLINRFFVHPFAEKVNEIKKYIDRNYSNIQSLSQIISKVYLTSSYACRIFKQATNMTIFEYLLNKRIEEAKRLLTDKRLKSSDIAKMVGYQDNSYFTAAFKKNTGYTPIEYRTMLGCDCFIVDK